MSEGNRFKLTTPYLAAVIILFGSHSVLKQCIVFVFVSKLLLCRLMSIAWCDSHITKKVTKYLWQAQHGSLTRMLHH